MKQAPAVRPRRGACSHEDLQHHWIEHHELLALSASAFGFTCREEKRSASQVWSQRKATLPLARHSIFLIHALGQLPMPAVGGAAVSPGPASTTLHTTCRPAGRYLPHCNTHRDVSGSWAATSAMPHIDLRLVSVVAKVRPRCRSWCSCWSGVLCSSPQPPRDETSYP